MVFVVEYFQSTLEPIAHAFISFLGVRGCVIGSPTRVGVNGGTVQGGLLYAGSGGSGRNGERLLVAAAQSLSSSFLRRGVATAAWIGRKHVYNFHTSALERSPTATLRINPMVVMYCTVVYSSRELGRAVPC